MLLSFSFAVFEEHTDIAIPCNGGDSHLYIIASPTLELQQRTLSFLCLPSAVTLVIRVNGENHTSMVNDYVIS